LLASASRHDRNDLLCKNYCSSRTISSFSTVSVRTNVLKIIGSTLAGSIKGARESIKGAVSVHGEESCPKSGDDKFYNPAWLYLQYTTGASGRYHMSCNWSIHWSTRDPVPNPSRENHGHGICAALGVAFNNYSTGYEYIAAR